MKSGAYFQQTRNLTIKASGPTGRWSDSRKQSQECRLPCTIRSDDSDEFADLDLKRYLAERPKIPGVRVRIPAQSLPGTKKRGHDVVAQQPISAPAGRDPVALT